MHSKKIGITLIVMIMLVSFFSGCIFDDVFSDDGTTFSLKSWGISDDEGFPSIVISFSCSDRVTLSLYDPSSSLVDSGFFLNGNDDAVLHLSSYEDSIDGGTYSLKVYDKINSKISTKTFLIDGPSLDILSCNQRWWKQDVDSYCLLGLEMFVRNSGDTPVYPSIVELSLGVDVIGGVVLPCVILPGESEKVYCFVYNESVSGENNFTVSLLDRYGNVIGSGSFSFKIVNNIAVRDFSWRYKYKNYEVEVPFIDFLYSYYIDVDRFSHGDYSVYVFDQIDDEYIGIISDIIMSGFTSMRDTDRINYAVSFVQNLVYREDSDVNDSYEYARYPVETLFNNNTGGGDCEDKAIFTASLLYYLGYDVALLRLPDHMAVGVSLDEDALPGRDYFVDDYYFLETTSKGHEVGYIPDEWESPSELTVYPISSRPLLIHNWKNNTLTYYTQTSVGDFAKVKIFIENLGLETAEDVLVEGFFFTEGGGEYNVEQVVISSIEPGMKESVTLMVDIPQGVTTRFKTQVFLDGELADTPKESARPFFL